MGNIVAAIIYTLGNGISFGVISVVALIMSAVGIM